MVSIFDQSRSGTIFGNPTAKWLLGSDRGGREAALGAKWLGEDIVVSYPGMDVRVPERLEVDGFPLGLAVGALVVYLWLKK